MSNTSIVIFASFVWFAVGFAVGWCVTIIAIRTGKEKIHNQKNDNTSIPTAKDALFLSSIVTSGPKYDCMSRLFKRINNAIQNGQKFYNLRSDLIFQREIADCWTREELIELFKPYNYKLEFFLQTSQIDVISWDNKDTNSMR